MDLAYCAHVVQNASTRALSCEAAALHQVVSGLYQSDLYRPSPCPPWTAGDLLCHILIASSRVRQALAAPASDTAPLVSTAAYYRPDHRFSGVTNADRIETAQALAARLGDPQTIAAELDRRCQDTLRLITAAPGDRAIMTRHGDRMLLADFTITRVVELAVHGLDLATALGRTAWLTEPAADVLEDLLVPGGGGPELRHRLGCDRAGLVARLTGRAPLSSAESAALADAGAVRLALG
jgi:uncharacterized protein (TIGR03083 family)